MSLTLGYDTVGRDVHLLPAGAKQVAGYTTGTGIVPWTPQQFAAHPGAIRICQDAAASDSTADVLDIESGAATYADAGPWYRAAVSHRAGGTRPGQRLPCIYTSLSNVTPLVNHLIAEGVHSGPRLWIAHWGVSQAAAAAAVTETGPWPIVGYQFTDPGPYDIDLWASDWLTSGQPVVPPPLPGWAANAIADLTDAASVVTRAQFLIKSNAR